MAHTDIKEVVRGLHGRSTGTWLHYTKSPTAQDAFWPIPGLISYAGVTGSMQEIELICHDKRIHTAEF